MAALSIFGYAILMEKEFGQSDPEMIAYAHKTFCPEDKILAKIRISSVDAGLPEIQVGAFDGLCLEILMRLMNARKTVEIGSLGGYSAVCLLRGMAPDGVLYAFELAKDRVRLIEHNVVELGGFAPSRLRAFAGPALENLKAIESEGPFDAVFIDADKGGYPHYLKWAAEHLRLGGAVIGDNTFGWDGVGKPEGAAGRGIDQTEALDAFNREASTGGRFRATILPSKEGMTIAIKIK